jgi:NAD(P)H-nitrite reductase large subunit
MARRHVLVGSGPGSIAAAEAIRSRDAAAEITIIGAEPTGYYSRPGLAYYLANEVPEKALFPFTPADIARLNVRLRLERVVRIDRTAHRVMLASGAELAYDRLLIATGSRAIAVKVPGADLDGVVKLDDMDDTRDLIRRSRRAREAVVVGGGITALEIVEGLRARRVHVHYFMRKDRYWSNVLSESESKIVEEGLRARGVQIHYFTELARIVGRGGRVVACETGDGTLVPCDLVAVAIGVTPQKELAEEAGLKCGRGILVDEYLRSSDEHIFAAGDVAEVCDTATDLRELEVLWSSAVAKGRIAGLNMAADPVHAYDGGEALNVTRLAGFKITIIGTVGSGKDSDLQGIARGDSQIWRERGEAVSVESRSGDAHIRLTLGPSTIAGAIVMGDQTSSFALQELIGARVDIGAVSPRLRAPGAPVAELVDELWRDWKAHSV